ncbi:MAG: hypothetical protein WDN76_01905 [Alphaproteobacteria bacterium]
MAKSEVVRVVLLPQDKNGDRQFVLDLKLNPETQVSDGPFPAWGRVGDYKKNETLFPFTLMMDGRLDYGAYATDAQRQAVLDIRKAKLVQGGEIALRNGDKTETFVIASVTPLVS